MRGCFASDESIPPTGAQRGGLRAIAASLPVSRGKRPLAERAAARNRAILWMFFDTGISLSELCALRMADVDRAHGMMTIRGQGARARSLALGPQDLRQLRSYLEQYRPKQEELVAWGNANEDHLFLSETRRALTMSGIARLFVRLRRRAGIIGKQVSPQMLRHSFALRYLQAGGSPRRLQEVLGYAGMAQIKQYLRWHNQVIHGNTQDT
ncbi:MAG: tyrosine-type recombinase/integrase [Ktedonobacteraceae bacterium]|nr:tyrosine-type recombinase/integrase [Ktedonobacteraceae bacterium]